MGNEGDEEGYGLAGGHAHFDSSLCNCAWVVLDTEAHKRFYSGAGMQSVLKNNFSSVYQ